MIFLTVGTIFPFDRLTRAVDGWSKSSEHEVFGQIGEINAENYRPKHFQWTERLSPVAFSEYVRRADLVVTHAGIGTIVSALSCATPLVLLPRKPEFQEVVNDHQMETIRRFEGRLGITIAHEPQEVSACIDRALGAPGTVTQLSKEADDSLILAIRNVIHG